MDLSRGNVQTYGDNCGDSRLIIETIDALFRTWPQVTNSYRPYGSLCSNRKRSRRDHDEEREIYDTISPLSDARRRSRSIAVDRKHLGYQSVDFPRDKKYKNIYLFILCVYISLISFFASPSVPLVSRTHICTKKRKRNTRILPRACIRSSLYSLKEDASPTTSSHLFSLSYSLSS